MSLRAVFFSRRATPGQGFKRLSLSEPIPQLCVVSRGGIWFIIQSSIAARIATAAPMITCTVIALVPWKPNTHGETSAHRPPTTFSHSSHIANAASAAIARAAMTRPVI